MNLAFLDLLGLAGVALLGARVAEELGRSPMIILTMGVITGVAGILLYLGLQSVDVERNGSMLAGIGCVALLRITAIIKKIRLPAVRERG